VPEVVQNTQVHSIWKSKMLETVRLNAIGVSDRVKRLVDVNA